jgi:hypothetical protein
VNAADHLGGLANALAAAGWSTRGRYEDVPAVLLVPGPGHGASVRVKAGTGGVPWFISSGGDPLRPCHDLAGTVAEIEARFGTSPVVGGDLRPARWRVLERIRRFGRAAG